MEVWETINGFSNYQISTLGIIKNLKNGNLLGLRKDGKNDYITVSLRNDKGVVVNNTVHYFMAKAFLPKIQINHIDGDKTNNKLDNLEWSNGSLNTKHAYDRGLAKKAPRNKKLTEEHVREIRERYTGARGAITGLAKEYKVSLSTIHELVNFKSWKNII